MKTSLLKMAAQIGTCSRLCIFGAFLSTSASALAGGGSWTVVGWNNLGMHCMDSDYSVFSILPPYNTIDSQLIDGSGKLITSGSGVVITYEAMADPDGSINRTATGKTNFWKYAPSFFGVTLPLDAGLAGNALPGLGNAPQRTTFASSVTIGGVATTLNWFEALGVPIAPRDDAGRHNTYPMMRLTARNAATNAVLARTNIVLPVSDEMDCRACHASSASRNDARPASGWINDPNPERDYRLNILKLHDEKFLGQTHYQDSLATMGFNSAGLFASVAQDGKPILCAACHLSEALGTAGFGGVAPLTRSMHALHATVINPANGLQMDAVANRSACYRCHPGSTTRCLRGAMGSAVAADGSMEMQCQSCHGTMSQVGAVNRTGWFNEPGCGNCHTGSATSNNGQIRYTSVFDTNGSPRIPVNSLFATNADTPAPGISLYRFSSGHGGLQCSACHGSTHAEFPSAHRNDNIQSLQLQGHAGVLIDCIACHATQPNTTSGGPHGMHPVGQTWVNQHPDLVERTGTAQCQICHGTNLRGTVLSRTKGDRALSTKFGAKNFWRGFQVSCYSCHNSSSNGDSATTHVKALANPPALVTDRNTPAVVTLPALTGWTYRIVSQPAHGTVALNPATRVATYTPETDFEGPDYFTFGASDGYSDSTNVGVVSITVGANSLSAATDGDGASRLLKYALGLSQGIAENGILPATTIETVNGQKYLTLTINRIFTPPDVTLIPEVSSDLRAWNSGAANLTTISSTGTQWKIRDNTAAGNSAQRFIRLRVTRP